MDDPIKTVADFTLEGDRTRYDLEQRALTLAGKTAIFDSGINAIVMRLPTSSEGLNTGELWVDGTTLKVME